MSHLTNEALNIYLDGALDSHERAAADAHLAICETCQAELSALRRLFATIELLPLDPLPIDLPARVLEELAIAPNARTTQRASDRESSIVRSHWSVAASDEQQAASYESRTTDYRRSPQPVLLVAVLVIQGALATALAIWLAPQLVGISSTGLGTLRLPPPLGLTFVLIELNDWLATVHLALAKLARAGDALSWNLFGGFTTAQWIMLLLGIGIVWIFGNRFLLAGPLERRNDHQEAA